MNRVMIAMIRLYQRFVSPVIVYVTGPSCRFHPSCSQYAIDALRMHGVFVGTGYALWRIMRCQPFSAGGYDPVPPSRKSAPASE